MKRLGLVVALLLTVLGATFVLAQNPVSISQVGVTPVTTTVPVSGTVTANVGTTNGLGLDSSLSTLDTDLKANVVLAAGSHVIGHVINDSGSTTVVTGTSAVSVADGSDTTLGAKADAKNTATDTTAVSVMSVLKQISASVQAPPSQAVTNAGTFAVTQATAASLNATVVGTGTFADQATLQTQTDTVMVGGVNVKEINAVTPLMGNGVTGTGSMRVTVASDTTSNTNPMYSSAVGTSSTAAASGCYLVSAASTNATSCKGSAGNVFGVRVINTTTTTYYLRLYNSSTAPTCSSATGFIETIPIPPAAAAGQAGGIVAVSDIPINYGTGIGFCFTGGSSSTDNTNAATGVFGAVIYK